MVLSKTIWNLILVFLHEFVYRFFSECTDSYVDIHVAPNRLCDIQHQHLDYIFNKNTLQLGATII